MPQGNTIEENMKRVKRILRREAHLELLCRASEDDAKGVQIVVEKNVNANIGFDINYVQDSFDEGVRREQTALVIALRKGYTETADCLIKYGADLDQALSLALLFFAEKSSLHAYLIAIGANVGNAFKRVMEHKYIDDYEQKKIREIGRKRGWNDKEDKEQKKLKSKLLLLALKHKLEDEILLQLYLLKGSDLNDALSLAIKGYQQGDESSILWLISCLIDEDAASEAASARVEAVLSGRSADPRRIRQEARAKIKGPAELGTSVNLNNALSMILEGMSEEHLMAVMLKISEVVNVDKVLYHALKHKPENDKLRSMLISKGANLNKLLETVVKEKPQEYEMISRLISKGANTHSALHFAEKTNLNKLLEAFIKENPENYEIISTLISKGANINDALHFVINYHPDNNELIASLISKGADVNYVVDPEKNYYILHEAIDKGCSEVVIRCLLEGGANPNEKIIATKGRFEKIGFALLTLSNPIGWLYLSRLSCAPGDFGNPFTEKHIDALNLARLKNNSDIESAIEQHIKGSGKNEKMPLLRNGRTGYGLFSSQSDEACLTIASDHTPPVPSS